MGLKRIFCYKKLITTDLDDADCASGLENQLFCKNEKLVNNRFSKKIRAARRHPLMLWLLYPIKAFEKNNSNVDEIKICILLITYDINSFSVKMKHLS